MTELRGMPVVNHLADKFKNDIEKLKENNVIPKLAIVRVGNREEDLSYERGIIKRFSDAGTAAEVIALDEHITQDTLEKTIAGLNADETVHGILVFRPLAGLSETGIRSLISPEKDVDGMSPLNTARVFEGDNSGFPPCTPQAVIEILDYYNIPLDGKKVTIVGRSLVVGKPLSMLMLGRNATVTVCHTKTADLAGECRRADILVACAGNAKMIGVDFVNPNQVVIDVGINMQDGKLTGDVDFASVKDSVQAITPVPGGVGTVTTSALLKATIQSALRKSRITGDFIPESERRKK